MGTVKIWTGTAWQTASQAVSGGSAASPAWVGPDAPTGTPKTGDLWYDSDDTNVLTLPLSVAQGGTGQATPAGARGSLAVPAIGNSLTTGGAPSAGTFARGDIWLDSNNVRWMCTTAGTPGTWASMNIGEELAYNQTTTNITIVNGQASQHLIVDGTTRTYDGSPIVVEVYASLLQMPATYAVSLQLLDGSTDLGMICELWNNPTATAVTLCGRRRLVPTVGSHTYKVGGWVNGGSALLYSGAQSPSYIRVTRS